MNKNITWLKNSLYDTVNEFDLKHIEKQKLYFKQVMLQSIDDLLKLDDVRDNLFILSEQIKIVYDKEANTIISKLGNIIFGIESYKRKMSKDKLYQEEYDKLVNQFEEMKNFFKKDMELVLKEKEKLDKEYNIETYRNYRRLISKLKYKQIINHDDLEILQDYFKKIKLTDVEQIELFEVIRLINGKISRESGARYSNAFNGNEVLNIMNNGFEKYDKPYIDSVELSKRIDVESLGYFNAIMNTSDVLGFLNNLDLSNYEFIHKQRIIINIIEEIQNKLIDLKELIIQKDFYLDIDIKNEIIKDYYSLQNKYLILKDFYENLEEDIEIPKGRERKNILIFLEPNASRQEKAYFEKDIEGMPKTQCRIIKNLLSKFAYSENNEKETRPLEGPLSKFCKIKDCGKGAERGQVRIVYRQLKDNIYLILGVFLKKVQNGKKEYEKITSRYYNINLTDELIIRNENIYDIVMAKLDETLKTDNQDKKL